MVRMARLSIGVAALLLGCATAAEFTEAPMRPGGRNSEYAVEDSPDGFQITVRYSRYQFIPESDAVAVACRQELTSLAYDHADEVGKRIEQINPDRIRISMGRNGITGITSCSATAPAKWAN
jgi:hypothetical protein